MANGQSTIVVYLLDGANRRFTIPYEYLARRFISITLMGQVGVQHRTLNMDSDFRFVTSNTIETTKAWGTQDGFETIEIRRETSATDRLVEFADGSVLRSRDLNVSAIQTIHIAEEARNLAATTLTTNDEGNLDARGRKISNVAPATEELDAVNFGQVTQWSGSALHQADRAESEANRSRDEANKSAVSAAQSKVSENAAKASQTAAKTSENAAKTSENAAKTSENAAKTSENAAKTSETAAKASQTAAKASQDAAKTSETAAKISETAAQNAQAQAQQIADSVNENTDIAIGQAAMAAGSATESAQSATASASSASKALASENAAKAAQDAAEAAQDAAEVSNTEAKEAATGSALSETSAMEKAAEATSAAETARGFSDAAASSVGTVHEHVNKAKDWAENPVNEPVEGDMFSAKHWASVAQGNVDGTSYLTKSGNLSELVDKEQARENLEIPLVPMGGGKLSYQSHELANQQDIENVENEIALLNDAKADNTMVDDAVTGLNAAIAEKADTVTLNANVSTLNTAIDKKADTTTLNDSVSTLNTAIGKKADQTALDATNTEVSKKADTATLNATVSTLNTAIDTKADQTALDATDTEVSKKADQTALDTANSEIAALKTRVQSLEDTLATHLAVLQSWSVNGSGNLVATRKLSVPDVYISG